MELILASQSPRRRELMELFHIPFVSLLLPRFLCFPVSVPLDIFLSPIRLIIIFPIHDAKFKNYNIFSICIFCTIHMKGI